MVVGGKLAKGGQAKIYAVVDKSGEEMVVKVFQDGYLVQDLEKQWPPAFLEYH